MNLGTESLLACHIETSILSIFQASGLQAKYNGQIGFFKKVRPEKVAVTLTFSGLIVERETGFESGWEAFCEIS